jgi:uncharacterized protein (TIGR00297 family)
MTFEGRVFEYLVISLFVAPFSLRFAGMDKKGSLAAFFVGFFVYISLGFSGFLVLLSLHVLGAIVTRTGFSRKQRSGIEQKKRSFENVCANGLLPAAAAVAGAVFTDYSELFTVAFVSAIAVATADTVSSELGELSKTRPRLITTFEPVDVGTDGAVTVMGTVAGMGGAAIIAAVAILSGTLVSTAHLFLIAAVSGFAGTIIDSILGATLERKGVIGNDLVNLFSIGVGLLLSVLLYISTT